MMKNFVRPLLILFVQQIFLPMVFTDEMCYFQNQSNVIPISCSDICCSTPATSPANACCTQTTSWSSFAIPIFIITGICCFAMCVIYLRPLLKICFCGCKCPCATRFQVSSSATTANNDNPIHMINNNDLPDYETIIKDTTVKDLTPPPYNFVTTHLSDFGLATHVPSAPPQYQSRCNSAATVRSQVPVD